MKPENYYPPQYKIGDIIVYVNSYIHKVKKTNFKTISEYTQGKINHAQMFPTKKLGFIWEYSVQDIKGYSHMIKENEIIERLN